MSGRGKANCYIITIFAIIPGRASGAGFDFFGLDRGGKKAHFPVMSGSRPQPCFRPALSLFIGLALLVQAMIPAGFMPGMSKSADHIIVICSGVEQKTIYVGGEGVPADGPHQEGGQSCAFALSVIAPFSIPALSVLVAAAINLVTNIDRPSFNFTQPLSTHPATGPPSRAR